MGDINGDGGIGRTSSPGRRHVPAASAASLAKALDFVFVFDFAPPPPFIRDDSTSSNPRRSVAAAPVDEDQRRANKGEKPSRSTVLLTGAMQAELLPLAHTATSTRLHTSNRFMRWSTAQAANQSADMLF